MLGENKQMPVAEQTNQSKAAPYLITGTAGFLGQHLTESLLDQGRHVVGVDVKRPSKCNNWDTKYPQRYRHIQADLIKQNNIELGSNQFCAVIHLASYVPKVHASDAEEHKKLYDGILNLTVKLLDFIQGKTKKMILASSVSVYGSHQSGLYTEQHVPHPTDLYGVYKLAAEGVVRCLSEGRDIHTCVLRFAQLYGLGEPHGRFLQKFINTAKQDGVIQLIRGGRDKRDLLHVKDAVSSIIQALGCETEGVFNIATGKAVSIFEMAEIVKKNIETPVEINVCDDDERVLSQAFDISLAKNAFGYVPNVSIEEGIGRLCRN